MASIKLFFLTVALVVAVASAVPWLPEPRPNGWMDKHKALLEVTHKHGAEIKVVFLGDSITEGWAHNGKAVWNQHYATRHAFNYGIGGDRTEHILYRIANGEFDKLNPKFVALMIGTNNLSNKDSPANTAKGVEAILKMLSEKVPHSKVLLLSVLPRNTVHLDTEVHETNKLISKFGDNKTVFYHDMTSTFETELAKEIDKLYIGDHLHLSASGYEAWYKAMEPMFTKLDA